MTSDPHLSWHRWLVERSYQSVGQLNIPLFDRVGYAGAVVASLLFMVCAAIICLALNAGTILFGILIEPIWTGRDRIRMLTLPGNIPVVLVTLPILIIYGLWRTALADGVLVVLAPFVVTAALFASMLTGILLFNRLRRG